MKPYCCYAKGILCVYASSYGGCLCSACRYHEGCTNYEVISITKKKIGCGMNDT